MTSRLCSGVFVVNFERISHTVLAPFIVYFEEVKETTLPQKDPANMTVMFLSCQGTPCSKQARYRKFK